ncbi:MAG: hypothetical protein AB7F09_00400 [Parvibaculaceae bacterium]
MKRRILMIVGALFLAGCAAKLVPDDYGGPTAVVRDSNANAVNGGLFKSDHAEIFAMTAVDGKGIPNGFSSTSSASEGLGMGMRLKNEERRVPIKPMKVTLFGIVFYPAPISTLFNKTYETRKTVNFHPVAGQTYIVRGKLGDSGSDVWIETASGKRVTQ